MEEAFFVPCHQVPKLNIHLQYRHYGQKVLPADRCRWWWTNHSLSLAEVDEVQNGRVVCFAVAFFL